MDMSKPYFVNLLISLCSVLDRNTYRATSLHILFIIVLWQVLNDMRTGYSVLDTIQ